MSEGGEKSRYWAFCFKRLIILLVIVKFRERLMDRRELLRFRAVYPKRLTTLLAILELSVAFIDGVDSRIRG